MPKAEAFVCAVAMASEMPTLSLVSTLMRAAPVAEGMPPPPPPVEELPTLPPPATSSNPRVLTVRMCCCCWCWCCCR
jgi:hypothetical protein